MLRGTNWIDGAELPAERGAWFEITTQHPHPPLGRWPRSTSEDLARALEAARRAEWSWVAMGAAARRELLRRSARRLLDAPDPQGAAGRAIGFEDGELAAHLAGLAHALGDGLSAACELARGPLGSRDGACVIAPGWAETWHEPARATWYALAAGRPVVLAPAGAVAPIGDALRHALEDLPPGVFNVLHDDGRTIVRAALLQDARTTLVVGSDRTDPDEACPPHALCVQPQRGSAAIALPRDLESALECALDAAIGRAPALSGSRAGQVGRVVVPARWFSRANDIVLELLEARRHELRPLRLARASQAVELDNALTLGLDEGATHLPLRSDGSGSAFPVVFTNVEPGMRVARAKRPLALILLVRARDAADARRIVLRAWP